MIYGMEPAVDAMEALLVSGLNAVLAAMEVEKGDGLSLGRVDAEDVRAFVDESNPLTGKDGLGLEVVSTGLSKTRWTPAQVGVGALEANVGVVVWVNAADRGDGSPKLTYRRCYRVCAAVVRLVNSNLTLGVGPPIQSAELDEISMRNRDADKAVCRARVGILVRQYEVNQ